MRSIESSRVESMRTDEVYEDTKVIKKGNKSQNLTYYSKTTATTEDSEYGSLHMRICKYALIRTSSF